MVSKRSTFFDIRGYLEIHVSVFKNNKLTVYGTPLQKSMKKKNHQVIKLSSRRTGVNNLKNYSPRS